MSSKEVKSINLRTWNAVPMQPAHNLAPHVIQGVCASTATQMPSRSVYFMTRIDVENNTIVKSVVAVLYEIVAPKTGRSNTL